MRRETNRGAAAVQDPLVALLRFRRIGDDVLRLRAKTLDAEFVEMGKFDGEFGVGTQTYVGTARARYAW